MSTVSSRTGLALLLALGVLAGCGVHRHQDLVGQAYELPWSLDQARRHLRAQRFTILADDGWNRVSFSCVLPTGPSDPSRGTEVEVRGVLIATGPASSRLVPTSLATFGRPDEPLATVLAPLDQAIQRALAAP